MGGTEYLLVCSMLQQAGCRRRMPTSEGVSSRGSKFLTCSWLLCGAKTTTAQIREDQKRCPVEQVLWETKR